jgi:co-chaperonin GroES (HSP10)
MVIKPILHRILVKPDLIEDVDPVYARAKKAGLVTEFMEKEREQAAVDTGVVVDMGETVFADFKASKDTVAVGDRVVYAKYGGKAIKHPETEVRYVLLNDEDIIAIYKEGA